MKTLVYWRWLALVAVGQLLGCASAPQYFPNTLEKNLVVSLNVADRGGFMTTVSAYAGINEMAGDCSSQYQGFVKLDDGVNKIGLAPGKSTDLVVEISRRTGSSSLSFKRDTLITPVAGRKYEIAASYVDGMFDFRLYEVSKSGKRELPLVPASGCRPSTK